MEKFKKFISYCSDELQLLVFSIIFAICFICYGKIFDSYNISALDRSLIIILVSFGCSACTSMFFICKRIFKK